jgi:hypothetical protein
MPENQTIMARVYVTKLYKHSKPDTKHTDCDDSGRVGRVAGAIGDGVCDGVVARGQRDSVAGLIYIAGLRVNGHLHGIIRRHGERSSGRDAAASERCTMPDDSPMTLVT